MGLTRPNGIQTSYAYDPASRLLALTHAGPGQALETLTYAYDPAGNRTADTRNQDLHQYGYDLRDQLTQVQVPKAANKWKLEEAYTYDAVGNRLTDKAQHASQYDAANRLTTDGQFTYAYDANGNLTEKLRLADGAQTHYTYDAEDRLIGVLSPKVEVAFQYDPLGRRTEKRVIRWEDADGDSTPDSAEEQPPRVTRYLYDGPAILATFTETGKERARYTHGPRIDEPLAELHRKQLTFYHADVLGSIIALTDAQGRPLRSYHYQAFGLPEESRGDRQPFRFTAREWDKEIKLYYYRARYYDPRSGRFLGEDPLGFRDGGNGYAYTRNNPQRFTDPLGLQTIAFGGTIQGGFLSRVGYFRQGALVVDVEGNVGLYYTRLSTGDVGFEGVTTCLVCASASGFVQGSNAKNIFGLSGPFDTSSGTVNVGSSPVGPFLGAESDTSDGVAAVSLMGGVGAGYPNLPFSVTSVRTTTEVRKLFSLNDMLRRLLEGPPRNYCPVGGD